MSAPLRPYERNILDNVEKYGCQVVCVIDPDGNQMSFAYSVGFPKSLRQPEVIVTGLSADLMNFMINETMEKCIAGFRIAEGARIAGLLDGYECVFRAVHPQHLVREYFNSAIWFAQTQMGSTLQEAFQIVWPGAANNLFPWQSAEVAEVQLALYEGVTTQ